MSHNHGHSAGTNLKIAFLLNLAFTIVEIFGGFWTNSIAILSDALHDAGDSLSLGIAWYLQNLSQKSATSKLTYGYRRFSTLGALITGIVLAGGLLVIIYHALSRLQNPEPVRADGMLFLAIVGIAFNGFAAWKLHGGHSLNEKVASWHLFEDTLGWAAVLLGSIAILIWNIPIIDPLLSIGISSFILWNLFKNMKQVFAVLLQYSPENFTPDDFDRFAKTLPNVIKTHHTHTWTLDAERHVLSTHLVMDESTTRQQIVQTKHKIRQHLTNHNFHHTSIEVELHHEPCLIPNHKHNPNA